MDKKLISILILIYNNSQYYKECLLSVLNQSYENIEIIISDDCSEEFPEKEIESFIYKNMKNNIKRVLINKNSSNLGVVKNYNKAIFLSNGNYIFYLSVDDVLYDETVLNDVVNYFENNDYLIATGYRDIYNESMEIYLKTQPRRVEAEFIKSGNIKLLFEKLCIGNFIGGCCTPFSRKIIDEVGYLDEEYFLLEDYPRYLKLLKDGYGIGFIDRKLIKYRMGGITTSGVISKVLENDLLKARDSFTKEFFVNKFSKLNEKLKNKEIIVWGTGYNFEKASKEFPFSIKYFVDTDVRKKDTEYFQKRVFLPEVLLYEDKKDIFVLVFSYSNYFEIATWLNENSFKEEENYYCFSAEILRFTNEWNIN